VRDAVNVREIVVLCAGETPCEARGKFFTFALKFCAENGLPSTRLESSALTPKSNRAANRKIGQHIKSFFMEPNSSQPQPTPTPAPGDTAPESVEPVSVEAQLALALADASSAKDQYLRALAEQDNIRKRAQVDIQQARDFAAQKFASELLSVKDTLEAVLADQVSTPEQLKMGVDMTLKQLAGAFERNKIKEVNPVAQKFDPNFHQAMSQEPSDQPEGQVLRVMQKGYTLADRMLRPAMVIVAAKPVIVTDDGETRDA
jgi:molecular chaperone GrpE